VTTGETRRLADNAPPGDSPGGLIGAGIGDRLVVTHFDAVSIFALSTSTDILALAPDSEHINSARVVSERYIEVHSVSADRPGLAVTTLLDGVTG
jgi:hypothetical protein